MLRFNTTAEIIDDINVELVYTTIISTLLHYVMLYLILYE